MHRPYFSSSLNYSAPSMNVPICLLAELQLYIDTCKVLSSDLYNYSLTAKPPSAVINQKGMKMHQ